MNLSEFLSTGQPDYGTAKNYALVFSSDLRDRLDAIQAEHGDPRHRVKPVGLTDGRWMLCADVLTEVGERGIYSAGFGHLDPALFPQVEVIAWADALALLPKEDAAQEAVQLLQ